MAAAIRDARPEVEVELAKGDGGDFIVTVESEGRSVELWNKNLSGLGFPEPLAIIDQLG